MPTNDEKSRFVSKELEIDGWKPGQRCPFERCEHEFRGPHDIPPPDLTTPAGADALMTALRKRGYDVEFMVPRIEIWKRDYETLMTTDCLVTVRYDDTDDHKPALLDAAYRLLSGSDR